VLRQLANLGGVPPIFGANAQRCTELSPFHRKSNVRACANARQCIARNIVANSSAKNESLSTPVACANVIRLGVASGEATRHDAHADAERLADVEVSADLGELHTRAAHCRAARIPRSPGPVVLNDSLSLRTVNEPLQGGRLGGRRVAQLGAVTLTPK